MNKKQLYEAPEAELLVVRFEENIMSYGDNGTQNGKVVTPGDGWTDGWDDDNQ